MTDTIKIDDGGQAFPQPVSVNIDGQECIAYPGMTLRDWFAGQFISRFAASDVEPLDVKDAADQFDVDCALHEHWSHAARAAYIAADEMIAARKGGAL